MSFVQSKCFLTSNSQLSSGKHVVNILRGVGRSNEPHDGFVFTQRVRNVSLLVAACDQHQYYSSWL